MTMQAFLPLVTYPDPNSDAVAANAVAFAAGLRADLHALALIADIPHVSNALSRVLLDLPQLIRQAEALSRKYGVHLLAEIQQHAAKAGVTLTTDSASAALALVGETAAARARYFDVALIGWEAGNPTSLAMAEAVVFGSGRPTILLPELTAVASVGHVAIAWDGSRGAARAVADAAPWLERASRISVLTVLDEKPLQALVGQRLVGGLGRRGLVAEPVSIHAEDCPIGVSLQEHAIRSGADMLVMGGYGHSRLRDFVLGGATQGVLSDLRLPVLLSH